MSQHVAVDAVAHHPGRRLQAAAPIQRPIFQARRRVLSSSVAPRGPALSISIA